MSLNVELMLEQINHASNLEEIKSEEEKLWENVRHEKAIRNISDIYESRNKTYEDYGLCRER